MIIPYVLYEDVGAALEFLERAFGFREVLRWTGDDGRVGHAEARLGDSVLLMGSPGPDYRNPRHTGVEHVMLVAEVDDVDAHYERAKAAGATILAEPHEESYGDYQYRVEDLEGYRWEFGKRVRDVAPEDWGAVTPA
ncbi:MAG TPA: VOC family protein [Acidimicrobiales bacterium]